MSDYFSVGEKESDFDEGSEASDDSLDESILSFECESDLTGVHAKAAALSPSGNHPSSLMQCSHARLSVGWLGGPFK